MDSSSHLESKHVVFNPLDSQEIDREGETETERVVMMSQSNQTNNTQKCYSLLYTALMVITCPVWGTLGVLYAFFEHSSVHPLVQIIMENYYSHKLNGLIQRYRSSATSIKRTGVIIRRWNAQNRADPDFVTTDYYTLILYKFQGQNYLLRQLTGEALSLGSDEEISIRLLPEASTSAVLEESIRIDDEASSISMVTVFYISFPLMFWFGAPAIIMFPLLEGVVSSNYILLIYFAITLTIHAISWVIAARSARKAFEKMLWRRFNTAIPLATQTKETMFRYLRIGSLPPSLLSFEAPVDLPKPSVGVVLHETLINQLLRPLRLVIGLPLAIMFVMLYFTIFAPGHMLAQFLVAGPRQRKLVDLYFAQGELIEGTFHRVSYARCKLVYSIEGETYQKTWPYKRPNLTYTTVNRTNETGQSVSLRVLRSQPRSAILEEHVVRRDAMVPTTGVLVCYTLAGASLLAFEGLYVYLITSQWTEWWPFLAILSGLLVIGFLVGIGEGLYQEIFWYKRGAVKVESPSNDHLEDINSAEDLNEMPDFLNFGSMMHYLESKQENETLI